MFKCQKRESNICCNSSDRCWLKATFLHCVFSKVKREEHLCTTVCFQKSEEKRATSVATSVTSAGWKPLSTAGAGLASVHPTLAPSWSFFTFFLFLHNNSTQHWPLPGLFFTFSFQLVSFHFFFAFQLFWSRPASFHKPASQPKPIFFYKTGNPCTKVSTWLTKAMYSSSLEKTLLLKLSRDGSLKACCSIRLFFREG